MGSKFSLGYNERLFNTSRLRSFYHNSRFAWLKAIVETKEILTNAVLELGCFDCKSLEILDPKPTKYVGIDSNWEGGLSLARQKYRDHQNVILIESSESKTLRQFAPSEFQTVIALETLEHLPPDVVDDYLREFKRLCSQSFAVTIPNELGPIFLLKYIGKNLFFGGAQHYTVMEVLNATIGNMGSVRRDDHKGFDYRILIGQIASHFEVARVVGLPFKWLPVFLNPTVAIIARPKTDKSQ